MNTRLRARTRFIIRLCASYNRAFDRAERYGSHTHSN